MLVVVSIGALFTRGLNLAIDFEGGSVWEIPSKTMTSAQAIDVLGEFNKADGAKVQVATDAKGTRILRVQADSTDIKQSQEIADAYAKKANVKPDDVGTNTVGPSWGSEITKQAGKSLIIFLVLIAAYISWQLEWRMAVAALIAVLHDVIVTIGIYALFQFEVTPATVISFLTILGYSLYDTIVVYDRVQENSARYDRSGQYTYTGVMRRSMNQVLMRSVNTTTVSLLPVASMLLIGSARVQPADHRRLLARPVHRAAVGCLLVDLHRGARGRVPQGARAEVPACASTGRGARHPGGGRAHPRRRRSPLGSSAVRLHAGRSDRGDRGPDGHRDRAGPQGGAIPAPAPAASAQAEASLSAHPSGPARGLR